MSKINSLKLITLTLISIVSFHAHSTIKPLDHIVVIVNDDVITNTMLINRVDDFKQQLPASQLSRLEPGSLKKQVLERMIRDTIQLQQAKQFGITVDDLMLNRMLEQIARNNKMSLEKFRQTIEAEGLNFPRFRQNTRDDIVINQLQKRIVANKTSISNQEIKQYIEQYNSANAINTKYHLKHILIATPESATPGELTESQNKANDIYKTITSGATFSDLAIKESSGRNALKGGDLGERKASELPQIFIDAAKDLKPGETSEPIKSASGFHLIHLVSSTNDILIIEQTHARHILVRTSNKKNEEQVRQLLLSFKEQIAKGKSFAELASEHSEDPGSKIKGGDLGWTNPGDFVAEFENVTNSLSVGQLSEPFKTPFGWHILEVLERRNHNQAKTNKENQARTALQKRKFDEEIRLWLRRIRDEAYVEYINK